MVAAYPVAAAPPDPLEESKAQAQQAVLDAI